MNNNLKINNSQIQIFQSHNNLCKVIKILVKNHYKANNNKAYILNNNNKMDFRGINYNIKHLHSKIRHFKKEKNNSKL